MSAKIISRAMPDTYFELVRQFPLTSIRNKTHLAQAIKMIDGLLERELDGGQKDYLDALSDLVEHFEEEHFVFRDATEAEVLRELMDGHGLTQSKLASEVNIPQSTISAVLTGTRSLTKEHILKLAEKFHVPASVFLPR